MARNFKTLCTLLSKHSDTSNFHDSGRNEWLVVQSENLKRKTKGQNTHYLINFLNGERVEVNADHLDYFVPLFDPSDALEDFKRLCFNLNRIPNPALAIYGFLEDIISRNEFDFLIDIARQTYPSLTEKQAIYLKETNRKLASSIDEIDLRDVVWSDYGVITASRCTCAPCSCL